MKFLILGCNGMAGHMISGYLSKRGHEVVGFDRAPSKYIKSYAGDATDPATLDALVLGDKYDSVINCIGILNAAAENNKALAAYLNAYMPHRLAQLTEGTDTQIIHMATDCVFSGKKGSYTESDLRDGETFYDRSKALGELEDDKNITLRNSIVGPDINPAGIGLMNWFLQQKGEVKGFTRAMWTGQTTLQLAKTMEAAALEKAHGLYNTVPDRAISKHDLISLFNEYIRRDKVTIVPYDGFVADKSLVRTRFEFSYLIPDYEIMVKEIAEWMRDHRQMYPHYDI